MIMKLRDRNARDAVGRLITDSAIETCTPVHVNTFY